MAKHPLVRHPDENTDCSGRPQRRIERLLQTWRSLPPLTCEEILGVWCGEPLHSGSVFTALLNESAWCGKVFRTVDDVDALVFGRPRSVIGVVNRLAIAPWRLPEDRRFVRHPLGVARLETRTLFGRESAAMRYRYLPIVDHFRRIDNLSIMGLMEISRSGSPELFFRLERPDPQNRPEPGF